MMNSRKLFSKQLLQGVRTGTRSVQRSEKILKNTPQPGCFRYYEQREIKMDQKQAEQVARLFNVVFNSAFLYGGSHPTTHKNITLFHEILESELTALPFISLIVDRESLYVEEWCMDKIINVKRIVSQLTKCEIMSLSFSRSEGR